MSIWPPACPPDLTVCWHLSLFGTLVEKVVYLWTLNNHSCMYMLDDRLVGLFRGFLFPKELASYISNPPITEHWFNAVCFLIFQSSFCIVRKSLFAGLAGLTTREVLAGKSYFGNEVRTMWTKVYRVEVSGHRTDAFFFNSTLATWN